MGHKYQRKNRARQRKRRGWTFAEQQRARKGPRASTVTWFGKDPDPDATWKFNVTSAAPSDTTGSWSGTIPAGSLISDVSVYDRLLDNNEISNIYRQATAKTLDTSAHSAFQNISGAANDDGLVLKSHTKGSFLPDRTKLALPA